MGVGGSLKWAGFIHWGLQMLVLNVVPVWRYLTIISPPEWWTQPCLLAWLKTDQEEVTSVWSLKQNSCRLVITPLQITAGPNTAASISGWLKVGLYLCVHQSVKRQLILLSQHVTKTLFRSECTWVPQWTRWRWIAHCVTWLPNTLYFVTPWIYGYTDSNL